jgi:DNA modification methylase
MSVAIHVGDCRDVMREMASDSVDAIVTDPPYEIGFMGKAWDRTGAANNVGVWREAIRLLKPGGHLLAFGGSRTYHRMACAIEDAGFEIRDQIMWVYGSGFPKSRDVSRAIDAEAGAVRDVVGLSPFASRKPNGTWTGEVYGDEPSHGLGPTITAPATEAARQWQGWGTALKPAHEPICMARKPFDGTVAENVMEHGTGALNIDASRVATTDKLGGGGEKAETAGQFTNEGWRRPWMDDPVASVAFAAKVRANVEKSEALGRWPANLIHDGSDEVEAAFAVFGPAKGQQGAVTGLEPSSKTSNVYGDFDGRHTALPRSDIGTASRFFYCAKASKSDRDDGLCGLPERLTQTLEDNGQEFKTGSGNDRETKRRNTHPTVKPTSLMRYLCRLITPPGGVILDPFAGTGSTGRGALLEGFGFVGIEIDEKYGDIARRRIEAAGERVESAITNTSAPLPLFACLDAGE